MKHLLIIGARKCYYDYYRQINDKTKENNAPWWNPLPFAGDQSRA